MVRKEELSGWITVIRTVRNETRWDCGFSEIPLKESAGAVEVTGSGGRVLAAKPRTGGGVFSDSPTWQRNQSKKRGERNY